jgi:hypothetical protein
MKYVKFTVEVWDDYDKVHDLMKYQSVQIEFWKSFVPPHRVVYVLGPLTDLGVENWTKEFNKVGCKYTMEVRINAFL